MDRRITDIHMHIAPGIDDGAEDLSMALEMLQMAYEQGAREIFCTSHSDYMADDINRYQSQLAALRMCAITKYPDLTLHTGCELLSAEEYIDDILKGLENGVYLPLGSSKYVLTELYTDATPNEAKVIVTSLLTAGWKPVLAHVERYPKLFEGRTIHDLAAMGAKIQINLYSLAEEKKTDIKERAQYLVLNRYAGFVGSDAHQTQHRPPKYQAGIQFIYENCDAEYANAICYKNAEDLLIMRNDS